MAQPDIVFITKENDKKIQAAIDEAKMAKCKGCGFIVTGLHECSGPFEEEKANEK